MIIKKEKIKKILCIKPRGIGDIVLSTIILENLHAYFPGVKIDYLTESFAKQAVEHNPLVHKVITMGKKEFLLRVVFQIRKEKYNMVLDLWSNPKTAQITFLSGAQYRIGFGYRGRKYAYNISAADDRGDHHSAEHNLELLKFIGIPIISKNISFQYDKISEKSASIFIEEKQLTGKTIIGIIPAGGWVSKRCNKEKWVEICKAFTGKFDVIFLILWGPGDEEDADYIVSELKEKGILAPPTTIPAMAALMKKCKAIISNDSGPMHIAAALNVPTIGLFGATDPEKHGPYSKNSGYVIKDDLHCIICNKLECPYNQECMKELSVDKIVDMYVRITA